MKPRTLYEGHRREPENSVIVRLEPEETIIPLRPYPSLNLITHSPHFDWGYMGAAPKQLALAILLDATGDEAIALRHYSDFAFIIVANFQDDWMIYHTRVIDWLDGRESKILAENLCQN